ncbi:HEAT repeat domain-containing protein [Actinosynnema sp. CA-248983]
MVKIDIPGVEPGSDVVRASLAGRVPRVPPSVALALLSELDVPGADRVELLRDSAESTDLDPHVRAGAVAVYARVAGADAVPTLLSALGGDDRVAAAAATALGHVGTAEHLDALRDRRGDGLLGDRARFAADLIVHRLGLTDQDDDVELPETAPPPQEVGALAFAAVRPGPERRSRALKAIKRDLPWFNPADHDVYEVQCGPRLLEIAVDRGVLGAEGKGKLRRGPATPAVVAVQDLEYDDFYPAMIALSRPRGDRLAVRLTRLTGEDVYVAEGSLAEGDLVLELRAAQRPGAAPVAGRLRVTAREVEISGVSDQRTTPKRTPQAE